MGGSTGHPQGAPKCFVGPPPEDKFWLFLAFFWRKGPKFFGLKIDPQGVGVPPGRARVKYKKKHQILNAPWLPWLVGQGSA